MNKFEKYMAKRDLEPGKYLTTNGNPVARYSMKCYFVDGREFTYRGDHTKRIMEKEKNLRFRNEVEALVCKFNEVKQRIVTGVLYDNSLPASEAVLFKYSNGKILINRL